MIWLRARRPALFTVLCVALTALGAALGSSVAGAQRDRTTLAVTSGPGTTTTPGAPTTPSTGTTPGTPTTPGRTPAISSVSLLRHKLSAQLKRAGGASSALVIDINTGRTLFAVSPQAARLPASVQKLYTTTAALEKFGPSATLTTTVLGEGALDTAGVWHGNLYLRGGGDPTFGSSRFDASNYGVGATVQRLAGELRRSGIHALNGAIVGDESLLDSARGTPATGMAADFEVEGELSGLSFDAGFASPAQTALQRRPALFATRAFAAALRAAGIEVPPSTQIYTGVTPGAATPLVTVASPPVSTLIRLTNAPSDNFFAELLLKDLGVKFGAGGTTADGVAVVSTVVGQQFGIHPRFDDGSGLSRYDRTTASQVVSLLVAMKTNRPFVNSLAVAGVSGTMKREMVGTRAAGNCRGKTGTLLDVANLAGYCRARNGDTLAFAFLLNSIGNSDYGHLIEARMGVALAGYNAPRSP